MSIELSGSDPRDLRNVTHLGVLAGELCAAQGIRPDQAHTVGNRGGQYAGQLVFNVLREMGVIPPEGIDDREFARVADIIIEESTQ